MRNWISFNSAHTGDYPAAPVACAVGREVGTLAEYFGWAARWALSLSLSLSLSFSAGVRAASCKRRSACGDWLLDHMSLKICRNAGLVAVIAKLR